MGPIVETLEPDFGEGMKYNTPGWGEGFVSPFTSGRPAADGGPASGRIALPRPVNSPVVLSFCTIQQKGPCESSGGPGRAQQRPVVTLVRFWLSSSFLTGLNLKPWLLFVTRRKKKRRRAAMLVRLSQLATIYWWQRHRCDHIPPRLTVHQSSAILI